MRRGKEKNTANGSEHGGSSDTANGNEHGGSSGCADRVIVSDHVAIEAGPTRGTQTTH